MAYQKTNWVDGQAPPISAQNLNKIENALEESYNGYLRKHTVKMGIPGSNFTLVGPDSNKILVRVDVRIDPRVQPWPYTSIIISPTWNLLDTGAPGPFDQMGIIYLDHAQNAYFLGFNLGTSAGKHIVTVNTEYTANANIIIDWYYKEV